MAIDPVCKIEVEESKAAATSEYISPRRLVGEKTGQSNRITSYTNGVVFSEIIPPYGPHV